MRSLDPFIPVHGGVHSADVLDFSANINPLGPPPAVIELLADQKFILDSLQSYPDRGATVLKKAVQSRYGVSPDSVAVGNGSAALLDAALRMIPVGRVLVPVPAFSEYRRAVSACGHTWCTLPLYSNGRFQFDAARTIGELRVNQPHALVLTNPHNPSGALCTQAEILEVVQAAAELRCTVILDEAFIDYAAEHSVMERAKEFSNLVVLRSLTKFYAMPAMRVGYAVTSAELAKRIEAFLPSWPVSTIALEIAACAMLDAHYDQKTVALNMENRRHLQLQLGGLGLHVHPSSANFLLAELPAGSEPSGAVTERLLRDFGIAVRNCDDYEGLEHSRFIRIAVKDAKCNVVLLEALRKIYR